MHEQPIATPGNEAKAEMAVGWVVYVLQCADGTLYTGITTDPGRRVAEHNRGVGSRYTRPRRPVTLVHSETANDRSQATRREASIKRMSRAAKMRLIAGATEPADGR